MKYGNACMAWLPLAAVITGLSLLVFSVVQQSYRQYINDPQVQIVLDAAPELMEGLSASDLIKIFPTVEISRSLTPWVAVYDKDGKPLASSGKLNGVVPNIPIGVLNAAASDLGKDTQVPGQNRVTWQSKEGVRSAIVVQYFSGKVTGFVVSGRNMAEIEVRERRLVDTIFIAWLGIILITLATQIGIATLRL